MKKWKKALISGATLLMLSTPLSASATTVVIDSGHGGSDPGAIGVNGLYEKVVNRDVAVKLKEELNRRGYTAILTSDSDKNMSLQERVDFKQKHNADLFVSIHSNSYPSPSASGSLVLYYDKNYPQQSYPPSPEMAALTPVSKKFAETVLNGLVQETKLANRGIVPSAVYVVRYGTMPSILVETAFLSNHSDAAKLNEPQFRTKIAQGIANGIWNFLPVGFKDIGGHWAQDAIMRLKDQGIVHGSNDYYSPQRPLSRAEFLAIADRIFQFPTPPLDSPIVEIEEAEAADETDVSDATDAIETDVNGSDSTEETDSSSQQVQFSDLDDRHWSFDTITKALQLGFVEGYPDGTFRPDKAITRAEVSALFDRIWAQDIEIVDPNGFDDVPTASWYTDAVYKLQYAGLITGIQAKLFAPDKPMTRAEAAAFFDRYIQNYGTPSSSTM